MIHFKDSQVKTNEEQECTCCKFNKEELGYNSQKTRKKGTLVFSLFFFLSTVLVLLFLTINPALFPASTHHE